MQAPEPTEDRRLFRPLEPTSEVPAPPSPRPKSAAWRRLSRVLQTDWPRLLIELFVLIAGITISFALDNWRSYNLDRRTERRSWEAIDANLGVDSVYLTRAITQLGTMSRSYRELLEGAPADSLDVYMDRAISYLVFTPTISGYMELQQTASSRVIRNRELLSELTNAYNAEYTRAEEWDGINRDFILERMIPYMDVTSPYIPGTGGGAVAVGMGKVYLAMSKKDEFRNLLRTNAMFKEAQRSAYELALTKLEVLRGLIGRELSDE
jgi:hypothetical protein